ncbi:MAG: hypothetical protein KIT36_20800 [Alphaproteobacteria bacterium]|nr:hypothetical protein [Alphaproteobacteria bacterium]
MDHGQTIVIDQRFNGPRLSGNGGYVAGVVAQHVDRDGAVEVTLRAPVPLDTAMTLRPDGDGRHALTHAGRLICEARAVALDLDPPGLQDWSTAEHLSATGGSGADSDFQWCLVCGRGRAVGDGLRVLGQRVGTTPVSLSIYRPHTAHAAADGRIDSAFLWGTLDCPGAWAVQEADDLRPAMTGRMTGRVMYRPEPGEDCMVVGWRLGAQGRKLFAGTALYTRTGILCAMAATTWIVIG